MCVYNFHFFSYCMFLKRNNSMDMKMKKFLHFPLDLPRDDNQLILRKEINKQKKIFLEHFHLINYVKVTSFKYCFRCLIDTQSFFNIPINWSASNKFQKISSLKIKKNVKFRHNFFCDLNLAQKCIKHKNEICFFV